MKEQDQSLYPLEKCELIHTVGSIMDPLTKFSNFVLLVQLKTSKNNIDSIKCQLVTKIFEPNLPLCENY